MTSDETPRPKRSPSAAAVESPPHTLPFQYEDRTDGRHQRLVQEVQAAHAWIKSRRAMGLRPN